MINPLTVASDGYLSPNGLVSLTIASRGYLSAVAAPIPPGPSGGGGAGGVTRRRKGQAPVTVAKRITREELQAKAIELADLEKQISAKTIKTVIRKVELGRLDLLALKQAIARARDIAPATVRKLPLVIVPADITLPLAAPVSDLNLRLLLLAGY